MATRIVNAAYLENIIWRMAPHWIGGPTSDVEVKPILRIARELEKRLYPSQHHKMSANELAAAAIHEYFSR